MKPTYALRNALLRQLGFSSYNRYLGSELWAEIRTVVLERDDRRCILCSKEAVVVHHLDYSESTLRGESFDGMVSMCHDCHRKIEFTKRGVKRTLVGAVVFYNARIARMYRKNAKRKKCAQCKVNKPKMNSTMCRPCIRESKSAPSIYRPQMPA